MFFFPPKREAGWSLEYGGVSVKRFTRSLKTKQLTFKITLVDSGRTNRMWLLQICNFRDRLSEGSREDKPLLGGCIKCVHFHKP